MEKPDVYEVVVENFILGVPRENIKQTLLAQGYSDFEIDKAIKRVERGEYKDEVLSKIMKKRKRDLSYLKYFLLAFVVMTLILVFIVLFFNIKNLNDGLSLRNNTNLNQINGRTENGVINCGKVNGLVNECFVDAARTCKNVRVESNAEFNMYDFVEKSTSVYELRGIKDGKCVFYYLQKEISAVISEEGKELLREDGLSEGDIKDREKEINDDLKVLRGKSVTCNIELKELESIVKKWEIGEFSYDDFGEDCTGELI